MDKRHSKVHLGIEVTISCFHGVSPSALRGQSRRYGYELRGYPLFTPDFNLLYYYTSSISLYQPLAMPLIMEPNPPPPPQNLSPPTPPSPTLHPTHLAIPLPFSPHTTLHLQITRLETSNLIFLTSTDPSTSGSLSSLGSFVYAMPNVRFPLSTARQPIHLSLTRIKP